jgi:hypothetical protein
MAVETQQPQPQTGLTFESVWTMFQETDKKILAMSQEADKQWKKSWKAWERDRQESREAWERSMQESRAAWERDRQESREAWERCMQESRVEYDRRSAETDRKIEKMSAKVEKMSAKVEELSDNLGGISNSLGDLAEGLMASDLYEKFEVRSLEFDHSIPNYIVKDKKTKLKLAEVDMLLVNGTIAMAVEVKTKMTKGDVDKHEERMDILRREPNSLFANRVLYGAMAGVKMSEGARDYAVEKGFYVIELTGNMVKIDVPADFSPKTW